MRLVALNTKSIATKAPRHEDSQRKPSCNLESLCLCGIITPMDR